VTGNSEEGGNGQQNERDPPSSFIRGLRSANVQPEEQQQYPTCDIGDCRKQFYTKSQLIRHKKTKHQQ
jgi:hypothetical protein